MDKVWLEVAGYRITNFLSYRMEADLYTAADAFALELASPEVPFSEGSTCEMWINGQRELTGIIDRMEESCDKSGVYLQVEGRDLMGLLVDSCCEEFITVTGMTLKTLTERLIRTVPYIQRKDIVYQQNVRGSLKKKKSKGTSLLASTDGEQNYSQIEPGQTIFEVLRVYAASRGMMFYALPGGTMVFGKPKDGGEPVYTITMKKSSPKENNAISGRRIRDISARYSKITVVGQQQGYDTSSETSFSAAEINTLATVTDTTFPFYKPFVTTDNNDGKSPKLHAQMLREQQRSQGTILEYTLPGHSQAGKNWTINEMCHVTDEVLSINADYLIYGRIFEMDSRRGPLTTVRLGPPGAAQ
jgi:prophage tail gpP-like protein